MKIIKQKYHNSCGESCIKMILNHYNRPILKRYKVKSFYDLRLIFSSNNLIVNSYFLSSIDMINFNCAIIQIKKMIGYHFVCLLKENNLISVFDPAKRKSSVLSDRYLKRWTGKIMIINNIL